MLKDKVKSAHEESLKHPGLTSGPPLPKKESDRYPTLYIFRHGLTEHNKNKIFCGRTDSKLTPEGIKQAEELAEKLKGKKIDLGIYSDLSRAKDTLDIVLKYHPNTKKEPSSLILERDYGDLTGKSKTELNKKDPELTQKYRRSWDFPPPNGESLKMVWENRVKKFCIELEKRMKIQAKAKSGFGVAVSCTNNTMRLIRMYFEKLTIPQMLSIENPTGKDYASYTILSKALL
jgi:broad specificity phosphatase PhoE